MKTTEVKLPPSPEMTEALLFVFERASILLRAPSDHAVAVAKMKLDDAVRAVERVQRRETKEGRKA